MKLKEIQVKNAKPRDREYKLADGQGLYLLVTSTGGKLWKWKYRVNGKEKKMSLGAYPEMKLAEARARHQEARGRWRDGVDPMAERKADKIETQRNAANSFKAVAEKWYEHWKHGKNAKHAESVKRRIEHDTLREIGHLPITEIKASHVREIALKIEARGATELARRAMGNIREILGYAHAHDLIPHNPAAGIKPGKFLKAVAQINYARVEKDQLPALLRKIDVYHGTPVTRIAIQLLAHTFVRTSELIEAEWTEIDWDAKRWTIPAHRMKQVKNTKPHTVPLAKQTITLLETLKDLTGTRKLLFPGERDYNKPMSNNTILKGLERMGYKGDMTGHGFRGLASTILHEDWPSTNALKHDIIDLQLAHMRRGTTASYDHSKHMPARTEMMQWWADYLERARKERSPRLFV